MKNQAANILVRARQLAGLSGAEASRRSGVHVVHLNAMEKGRRGAGVSTLIKLADTYGVTLDQLVGRAPLPAPEAAS